MDEIETKKITYKGFEYLYRIRKNDILKNHYYITVVGGPNRVRGNTSCGKDEIKSELMKMIKSMAHHRTRVKATKRMKMNRRPFK